MLQYMEEATTYVFTTLITPAVFTSYPHTVQFVMRQPGPTFVLAFLHASAYIVLSMMFYTSYIFSQVLPIFSALTTEFESSY